MFLAKTEENVGSCIQEYLHVLPWKEKEPVEGLILDADKEWTAEFETLYKETS